MGGQAQTRLRSPWAWSMRRTGGKYWCGSAYASGTRWSRASTVCGALTSGLSEVGHFPAAMRSASALIAVTASPEEINSADCDAIYFTGGHAVM